MNKFKKKSLYLAVVAGIGAISIAGNASAVNVNGDGLGQVLIYPYYTVRNGTDTYISITNSQDAPKAVKVRFTEGKNSREVLDFNLYLSAHDMWAGAITATTDGAKLVTVDKSCTAPAIPPGPSAGQAFVNYSYSGAVVEGIQPNGGDGEVQTLDRTREGYFEVIEMGVITDPTLATAITHVSGTPANCAVAQAINTGSTSMDGRLSAPSGGLSGNATLINVAEGTDYGYDPTALDNFSSLPVWYSPGDIYPDLTKAFPADSVVFDNNTMLRSYWSSGQNAVSAVLMHDQLINDYVLDNVTLSGTDWVITMPTKRYYVPVDAPPLNQTVYEPFTVPFYTNGACEVVGLEYWDREEQYVSTVNFSPPPPVQYNSLCWETNVVTFRNSNVLGSSNSANIPINSNFQDGWARISFNNPANKLDGVETEIVTSTGATSYTNTVTYYGLPVVGFMVQDFVNGDVGGVLSNYGGNFNHKMTRNITYTLP